jgi:hypothetical protein
MHALQTVYFRFRQHYQTTNQTHGGEASLSVGSMSGGRLSDTKGGPLCCPYSGLPAVKTDPSNVEIGGMLSQVWERS